MRILHVISSGGMYGAEAVILNLARVLGRGPHTSTLGVFANAQSPNLQLHEVAVREGIESVLIPCSGQIDRTVPAAIRNLAQSTGADVVHAHGYKADIYAWLALRGMGTPLVSTCHTWYDNDLAVRVYGAVDRFVLRGYAAVIAVSKEVEQKLLDAGVRSNRVHVVRNGIDLAPFDDAASSQRSASAPFTIGLVGRLAPEKGVDIFLRAAKLVLAEQPAVRFVVIGDGPDREQLQALIAELGLASNAALLGRQDGMSQVYASLDVMVSASRQEGMPIALLEGMASRRPVVATVVGEVPSLIRDGETGLLVQPNDPDALAQAMLRLVEDSGLRGRLGESARTLVEEEFSAGRMATEYLRIYEAAVHARAAMRTKARPTR